MIDYLCIIQARIGSTRFPNKVMETVGGVPIVKRVWLAAKGSWADKVIVAWPERFPELPEDNVLGRFKVLRNEFKPVNIIRLTADCPLLSPHDINDAIKEFNLSHCDYYNNRKDGHDVQIFKSWLLDDTHFTHRQHVINDIPNVGGYSVDNDADLERVRKLC